jgi:hypothetical protein
MEHSSEDSPDTGKLWIRNEADTSLKFADDAGGAVTITGGNGNYSGGDIILTGGDCTGSGMGGSITLTTGNASGTTDFTTPITVNGCPTSFTNTTASTTNTTLNLSQTAMSLSSAGGPEIHFLTGSSEPPEAPRGSLYMRDDGASGSLWVKVSDGPGGWSQLVTNSPCTEAASDVDRAVQSVLDAPDQAPVMQWAIRKFEEIFKAKNELVEDRMNGERSGEMLSVPGVMDLWIPCVAPVSSSILADMMALLEQEGHQVEAFVSSSRDFADIRKFATGGHVRWEGKNVLIYGVPFLHTNEIPPGFMGAVTTERLMCVTSITR